MKERYIKPDDAGKYGDDEHPFGRPEAEKPVFQNKLQNFAWWFKNRFWYYHRLHVLIALPVLAVVAVLIHDLVTTVRPDFTYVMTARQLADENSFAEINDRFAALAGDLNGDGRVSISSVVLSPSDNDALAYAYDMKFTTLLTDKSCVLFLFDESAFSIFTEPDAFADLTALGLQTLDEYPWIADLTELPLIRRAIPALEGHLFAAMKPFPEDAVGGSEASATWELGVKLLHMLVSTP